MLAIAKSSSAFEGLYKSASIKRSKNISELNPTAAAKSNSVKFDEISQVYDKAKASGPKDEAKAKGGHERTGSSLT